ncbi:uncharacterized protein LOC108734504 [Agrilus planipennis]|uniref:Uncharacterized protein LOC108734504 n=1 Tax=Agrilus planipennis TaxID=224129 RepID=A0A1W4WN98_AGRPL|nr:uncharacterized protein LOC108734504 [Agrilus planipennis]
MIIIAINKPSEKRIQEKDLETILQESNTQIGGDLNSKHPAWGSRSTNPNDRIVYKTLSKITGVNFYRPEDYTTILENGTQGDVINFLIGYRTKKIQSTQTLNHLLSDHFPVIITMNTHQQQNTRNKRTKTDWIKFQYISHKISGQPTLENPTKIDEEAQKIE